MHKIVVVIPDRDHYLEPIKQYLNYEMVFVRKYNIDIVLEQNPVVVIFMADWIYQIENMIIKLHERNIPTILLMDGIIEWKGYFENPKWSYGDNPSPFIPILCDKVLVPGFSTFRFLEYFGNEGKCEIVGQPRFDVYQDRKRVAPKNKKKIIGVMSANTAGYTESQVDESIRLFEDIFRFGQSHDFHIAWRLRKGFHEKIKYSIQNDSSTTLLEFLNKVDCVICQPSTAAYEAMILELPVAIADYNIAPNLITSAWSIHSKDQIEPIVKELLNPSALKLHLQNQLLDDTIAFIGKSSYIVGGIINDLAEKYLSGEYEYLNPPKYLFKNYYLSPPYINISENFFNRRIQFTKPFLIEEHLVKQYKYIEELERSLKSRKLGYWVTVTMRRIFKYFKK